MESKEFLKAMKILSSAYNKDFDEDSLRVWYLKFKKYDYRLFAKVLDKIIETKNYMPSIAEVIKEIEMTKNPKLNLNANEEWEKVIELVRRGKLDFDTTDFNNLNDLTKTIVRAMSIARLNNLTTDETQWARKEFIEMFENKKDYTYENNLQVSIGLRELLQIKEEN